MVANYQEVNSKEQQSQELCIEKAMCICLMMFLALWIRKLHRKYMQKLLEVYNRRAGL
jgi:hypothetical protein